MTVGMGIFLAAVVWGIVTIWVARRPTSGPSLWEKFIKFLRLAQRAIGLALAWGAAICLLLFLFYVFENVLTSWLGDGFSTSKLINWDLREAAFFIVAILFICGAYAVPLMILEGDNEISDLFDKMLIIFSRGRVAEYWRDGSNFEKKKLVSASQQIVFFGMIFTFSLTSRIAELFMNTWELYLVPFYANNQAVVGSVLAILWIGGILMAMFRDFLHK